MKNKFIIAFYGMSIFSCTQVAKKHEALIEPTHFDRSDFAESITLTGEVMNFESTQNPAAYYVVKDSLLLVENYSANPYFLSIYNLNSRQWINDFVRRGNGPNELLGCDIAPLSFSDNLILIDRVGNQVAICNIDSLIQKGVQYQFKKIKYPNYVKEILPLKGDTLVTFDHWYLNDEKYGNNVKPFNYFIEGQNLKVPERYSDLNYFTSNVSGGHLLANDNRIIFAHYFSDELWFVNSQLGIDFKLKGPDDFNIRYSPKEGMPDEITFKENKFYRSYYKPFFTNEYIYLIYGGINGIDASENYCRPTEIFMINWEGELLRHYLLDKFVYTITLDSSERFLFGTTCESFDEIPKLIKYQLK